LRIRKKDYSRFLENAPHWCSSGWNRCRVREGGGVRRGFLCFSSQSPLTKRSQKKSNRPY
jgi:hypothetical protein